MSQGGGKLYLETGYQEADVAATFLKLRLFLGSYSVLFAILAIRFTDLWLLLTCAALAVIGLVDNWRIVHLVRRKEPHSIKVEAVHDQGAEVAGYLATYLLPFVTVAQPSGRDLAAYGLFIGVTCLVYIRSEMVQINPAIYLLKRKVVSVTTSEGLRVHLIIKGTPERDDVVNAVPLRGELVMVEVERDGEE